MPSQPGVHIKLDVIASPAELLSSPNAPVQLVAKVTITGPNGTDISPATDLLRLFYQAAGGEQDITAQLQPGAAPQVRMFNAGRTGTYRAVLSIENEGTTYTQFAQVTALDPTGAK